MGGASVMPLEIDRIRAERDAAYCTIGELNDKVVGLSDTIGYMKERDVALNQDMVLLRNDNAKLNQEKTAVENLFKSAMEVAVETISGLVAKIQNKDELAERLKVELSGLQQKFAIEYGYNGSPSKSKPYGDKRAKFQKELATHLTKKRNESVSSSDTNSGDVTNGDVTNGDSDLLQKLPKNPGGQPGHVGKSREGKCEKTILFKVGLSACCGRADMIQGSCVRKRVFGQDVDGVWRTLMYVWYHEICPQCGQEYVPDTDAISGSAFLPNERALINMYNNGGTSVRTAQGYIKDREHLHISIGAMSNCVSATANLVDSRIIHLPIEKPLVIDEDDLRLCRMPIEPAGGWKVGKGADILDDYDADDRTRENTYAQSEALQTRYSTVWTSSVTQPKNVHIMEVASMQPYSKSDESPHKVKKDNIQMLTANTIKTEHYKAVEHKYVSEMQMFLEWGTNRPNVRDGYQGYSWHNFDFQRCTVHISRKVEDAAIDNEFDSPECTRHILLSEIFVDAKASAKSFTAYAGGPMQSACDLNIIKEKGLDQSVQQTIAQLLAKYDKVSNMIEDTAATTLKNARENVFTGIKYPGVPLHNNDTEHNVRDVLVSKSKRKGPFPNWTAARNFGRLQTFFRTCRKNGTSAYDAIIKMSADKAWDIFTSGIPPPIMINTKQSTEDSIRP